MPLFRKKTAFSPEVVTYIRNHRVATTSRNLGNSWLMLHVKKYLDTKRTYLQALQLNVAQLDPAYEFSAIDASRNYDGVKDISAKLINVVWIYLMNQGGLAGFARYMKSLASEATTNISWDATHSFAEKGKTIINNQRIAAMKSLSVIVCNRNYIQSAIFTHSHRNVELEVQFEAFAKRLDILQIKRVDSYGRNLYGRNIIEKVGTDYTEKYGGMIKRIFPKSAHAQDVFHWLCRFHLGIVDGVRNPFHHEVVVALSIAWRESKTRTDIINNFEALYKKYQVKGSVWNTLAKDIFSRQMQRVHNGWMDKGGDSANTSRVENKFRHIERVQSTFTCSLQLFESLGLAKIDSMNRNNGMKLEDPLIKQTYGYSDIVYANQVQLLEKSIFHYKASEICVMPEDVDSGEEFGVVSQHTQRRNVPREEEDDPLVDEYDDEAVDYIPQAIANDYLDQCELESLGLDSSKRNEPEVFDSPVDNRYKPIEELIEKLLPENRLAERDNNAYQTPPLTPSMQWLNDRSKLAPEVFAVGEGMVYHLFMKLRRHGKWRSSGATNFRAAELTWKQEVDAYHARAPNEPRLPEYDHTALRNKCIEIEKNLPVYLSFWQGLHADGIEVHVNKEGEDCVVIDKVQYWLAQDLREEVMPTPANRKGKIDVCKRCNLRKTGGSGHGVRTCIDGVLVSTDKDIVRYPQPEDLFLSSDGCLNPERFRWLLSHSAHNSPNDSETRNFAIFAKHILTRDGAIDHVKLASLKINIADPEVMDKHHELLRGRKLRNERTLKKARFDLI